MLCSIEQVMSVFIWSLAREKEGFYMCVLMFVCVWCVCVCVCLFLLVEQKFKAKSSEWVAGIFSLRNISTHVGFNVHSYTIEICLLFQRVMLLLT